MITYIELATLSKVHRLIPLYSVRKLPTIDLMNIELRFGANEGGQQPSEMSYLADRENALLAHTLDRQISVEIAKKMSEIYRISNRNWSKNRSYRKQMTKPCLTGARTAIRASAICEPAQAYFLLFESLRTLQVQREIVPHVRRAAPASNHDKISPLARATAKNLCGTLGIWGNSEVA